MSVAIIPMAKDLGWSNTDRGLVSSAFFWGYAATQVPAGWVSTSLGGARVLMAGVALWSVGTLMAPPAARMSITALCVSRVIVGLGEGLAPSSATNVLARIIPEAQRARAVTLVFGALDVGSAIGLLISGPLIRAYGWPSVFYLFAALGLVWVLAWPFVKPERRELKAGGLAPAPPAEGEARVPVPWGAFLRSVPVWAIICAHFCYNWGYYTLLAWLPSYFELSLGLNVQRSSLLTLIPYLAMTAMTPFVGPVADGLVANGWPVTRVRKLCQGISFAGPALCMVACGLLTPLAGAGGVGAAAGVLASRATTAIVALLSISFALGAWARAGLYCNHQDLSPKYAGALLGLSNTAGAMPGVLGVTLVGVLLDKTGSWGASLFYPTALCQLVGMLVYTTFASSKRQAWE
jgi:ACS family sodium-dependent inorganic phosphate cotransporter